MFFPRLGIKTKFIPGDDPKAFGDAIDEKTKAVYVESIGNPRYNIPDFDEIVNVAHAKGVPVVVDNTFGAGGFFIRPFDHGADIIGRIPTVVRQVGDLLRQYSFSAFGNQMDWWTW